MRSRWDELKRLRSRCAVAAGGRAGRRVRSGCFACGSWEDIAVSHHPGREIFIFFGRFSFGEPWPCVFAIAASLGPGRSNFRGWTGGGTYGRMRRWVLFICLIICLIQLVFSAGTVFFSHKKSANSVFQSAYNSSRTAPWCARSAIAHSCPGSRSSPASRARVEMGQRPAIL
jgi:hypothetical protein